MKIVDLKNNKVVENIEKPIVLLLGNFDGVHEGHSKLVESAVDEGKRLGIKVGVWTFEKHPLCFLGNGVLTLTDNNEKNKIFAEKGIDYIIYEDFMESKDIEALDFVNNVLIEKYDCRTAVCGFNFKFGKQGKGKPEFLKEIMESKGRNAIIVLPVCKMEKVVSSTEIRGFLEKGLVEEAATMLGRPYSIELPVMRGNELGRTIGIPTINQKFPEGKMILKNGIYACKCVVEDKEYLGVANVGSRPTVNNNKNDVNCETHIIDFTGWLYGKDVRVQFYKRLRDEKRFDSLEDLKIAVLKDIEKTKEYFGK